MRSEHGAFLVDGPVLLAEALDAGVELRAVYVESDASRSAVADAVAAAADAGVAVREVVPGALSKVLDLGAPQSVVAVATQPSVAADGVADAAIEGGRGVLVLVDVADPGNVGTLVRSAEAAGCAGVVLVGRCADLYNSKTVRATAGAVFRVPVAHVATVEDLRVVLDRRGIPLVGTVGSGGVAPEDVDLRGAVAVLVGSEAHGLAPEVVEACHHLVAVPMEGRAESLNAAVAGSVVAFDAARQRRVAGRSARTPQRSGNSTAALGHNDGPAAPGPPSSEGSPPEHGSSPR